MIELYKKDFLDQIKEYKKESVIRSVLYQEKIYMLASINTEDKRKDLMLLQVHWLIMKNFERLMKQI